MKIFRYLIIFYIYLLCNTSASKAGVFILKDTDQTGTDTSTYVSPYQEDNERCFKCHGQSRYEYTNVNLSRQVRDLMCSDMIISRKDFYDSNHKGLSCTDCHSEEYTHFPHAGNLRMEPKLICLDCHGGDEKSAKYHFEEIESEYKQSVHYKLEPDGFSCWSCHNPHTYKISVRNASNTKQTIAYDNAICLNCHSDFKRFQLLTNRARINLIQKHDWLPDQTAHFANVRCIECHAEINNKTPVAHLILPESKAVKLCNECHSKNSMLMASLYKFASKEQRRAGFFNSVILNESYVIGANRNEYLNLLSFLVFFGVLAVIAIHIIFRIRKHNKKSN